MNARQHHTPKPAGPKGSMPVSNRQWIARSFVLIMLYGVAGQWSLDQNVDVIAAALPGWKLVQTGSLDLSEFVGLNPWIVETTTGAYSNRPLGLIILSTLAFIPTQLFTSDFSGIPTTIVAVVATAAAVVILARIAEREIGPRAGTFTWLALGLGSAAWPISSAQMWPHGIDQLWIALMMWGTTRGRPLAVATAAAAAVMTRPPVAVISVVVAAVLVLRGRSARGAPGALVLGTGLGTSMVLIYNNAVFGTPNLSGGYGDFVQASSSYRTPTGYLSNLAGTLFDPAHGVMLWSPWLVVCLIGMPTAWKSAPTWMRTYAIGGLAYLLVHTALNRYWGGLAFNYRYAIEAMTASMPLLASAWLSAVRQRPNIRRVIVATLAFAIVLQGTDALLSGCETDGEIATCRLIDL